VRTGCLNRLAQEFPFTQGQKGQAAEQCLKNNESKLSSQCKGAVSKSPQQ